MEITLNKTRISSRPFKTISTIGYEWGGVADILEETENGIEHTVSKNTGIVRNVISVDTDNKTLTNIVINDERSGFIILTNSENNFKVTSYRDSAGFFNRYINLPIGVPESFPNFSFRQNLFKFTEKPKQLNQLVDRYAMYDSKGYSKKDACYTILKDLFDIKAWKTRNINHLVFVNSPSWVLAESTLGTDILPHRKFLRPVKGKQLFSILRLLGIRIKYIHL